VIGSGTSYISYRLGYPLAPDTPELRELLGAATVVARVLHQIFNAVVNALFAVIGMVLLKIVVKREKLAAGLAIALVMLFAVRGTSDGGSMAVNAIGALVVVTTIVLTIQRLGLVATTM